MIVLIPFLAGHKNIYDIYSNEMIMIPIHGYHQWPLYIFFFFQRLFIVRRWVLLDAPAN
jgi:hypothetical protein